MLWKIIHDGYKGCGWQPSKTRIRRFEQGLKKGSLSYWRWLLGLIPRAAAALFNRLRPEQQHPRPASGSFANFLRSSRSSQTTSSRLRPVSMIGPPRRGSTPNLSDKSPRYTVKVSFIEIREDDDHIFDLLHPGSSSPVLVRKEEDGSVSWAGIKEIGVGGIGDILR